MNYRRAGAGLGGESGTDQTFCGENATRLSRRTEVVWVGRAVAAMGTNEGTLQRASQPSIIMHPDSAMPTGPSRIHSTRIASVASREPLMACEYPAGTLLRQVLAWESTAGTFMPHRRALSSAQVPPPRCAR